MNTPMSEPVGGRTLIRVGFVGIGTWARHGHVRVLGLLPEYQLSAIYSQRREASTSAAKEFGFKHVVDSIEALVSHPEVDLVVVLTTAPQHEVAVRAAIAAGKQVYCEWPLTVKESIAKELLGRAKNAGVRHVVGLQRRLAPHNRYLRDLIAEGFVGKRMRIVLSNRLPCTCAADSRQSGIRTAPTPGWLGPCRQPRPIP
jgi:predicted dehydrogenase